MLPIEPILADLISHLERHSSLVLVAAPGAGKSTRVPPALAEAPYLRGQVVVLQPRRVAARLLASRVAEEQGTRLGAGIGYQVRYDNRTSAQTRVVYMTEGVFLNLLTVNPLLDGIGAVVLDEFHQRTLATDLSLALVMRLQSLSRPDLRVLVMSATMEGERVASHLNGARLFQVEGRLYPVEVRWSPPPNPQAWEAHLVRAVLELADEGTGDTLVFLPGAGEIRALAGKIAARTEALAVRQLYGDLPLEAQVRALSPDSRPRVILTTNIAETSITVPGVTGVVDSGRVRVARVSPWSGLSGLHLEKISRASAEQRAGRAGRLGPGTVIRLYSQLDYNGFEAFEKPEILRGDLTDMTLLLATMGLTPETLAWLDPPEPAALEQSRELLTELGLIQGSKATTLGLEVSRLPLHPRVGRLLVEAGARGRSQDAALAAALLSERPALPRDLVRGKVAESDLEDLMAVCRGQQGEAGGGGSGRSWTAPVLRAARQLSGLMPQGRGDNTEDFSEVLGRALLASFPDRVARRRSRGSRELVLCDGREVELSEDSVVQLSELLVALDAVELRDPRLGLRRKVTLAAGIEPEWLLDIFPDRLTEDLDIQWNKAQERVEVFSRLMYRAVALESGRVPRAAWPPAAFELLADRALKAGINRFVDPAALEQLLGRLSFLMEVHPDLGPAVPGETFLEELVRLACRGSGSFRDLENAGLLDLILGSLPPETRVALERAAPVSVDLPGRRRAPITYAAGARPFVASAIQDFFSLKLTPSVQGRRLLVHLLGPNKRPVQITDDLEGFWVRHYPGMRNQLMRRYPRHYWPEDPANASPKRPSSENRFQK